MAFRGPAHGGALDLRGIESYANASKVGGSIVQGLRSGTLEQTWLCDLGQGI